MQPHSIFYYKYEDDAYEWTPSPHAESSFPVPTITWETQKQRLLNLSGSMWQSLYRAKDQMMKIDGTNPKISFN